MEKARAREFVRCFGKELGLKWDEERDCLEVGRRSDRGESLGRDENTSNYFRAGQTPGQPRPTDRFTSFDDMERIYDLHVEETARETTQLTISEMVDVALESLSQADRELIFLRFFDRLTLKEIGEELSISYQAVQSRLNTVLKRVRTAIVRMDHFIRWLNHG